MAKKKPKSKPIINPNEGQIIKWGNKYRNTKTNKFASKKDFAKSNFQMILDNQRGFTKGVVKAAKGYSAYYNNYRYNGKSMKRQVAHYLQDNLTNTQKKELKMSVKEYGYFKDWSMIMPQSAYDVLQKAFHFTFERLSSYELDSGFLTKKEDNMHNIVKELAYYRGKGYEIKIIDNAGERGDISTLKDFERQILSDAQAEMEAEHTTSSKAMYLFNIEHEMTVDDDKKIVTVDLRNATNYISDSKEAEIIKAKKRRLKKG